jgi:hypothetical protein
MKVVFDIILQNSVVSPEILGTGSFPILSMDIQ